MNKFSPADSVESQPEQQIFDGIISFEMFPAGGEWTLENLLTLFHGNRC